MDLSRIQAKVKELQEKKGNIQFGEMKKVIQPNVPNIVRLTGEWVSVKRAWLECDDGKPRPFNIYNEKEESLLFQIINLVLEQEKIFDPKTGKAFKRYKYSDKLSLIADRIFPNKSQRGWSYSESYLLNCIDRMDNWCSLNRHTKLLTKTPSEIGIGGTALQALKDVITNWGDPETYDLNFMKSGTGLDTAYNVQPINPQNFPQSKTGPLTPEEKSYDLYDIYQLVELSKADYILKHLRNVLIQIDTSLQTNFIAQLETLSKNQVAPVQVATAQAIPIQTAPVQSPPIQTAPVQSPPNVTGGFRPVFRKTELSQAPIQQAPIQQAPIQQAPIQQAPIQQAPIQQAPIQQAQTVPPVSTQVLCPLCGALCIHSEGCKKCDIKFM